MCGIFGFVTTMEREPEVVLQGLRFLEYRGYDSWGIAVGRDGTVETDKATVEIPSPFAGRVARIHVQPGQSVKVGDVLVTFEDAAGALGGGGVAGGVVGGVPAVPQPVIMPLTLTWR